MEKINPNNIRAFEGKELSELIQGLENLKLAQGVVMETPPEVYEILGRIYNDEHILLKSIELVGSTIFEFSFIFPEYNLTKKGLEHVSGAQMTIARFQALYTAIGLAIKTNSIASIISYETFLSNMYNVLDREYHITHSKVCMHNQKVFLQVEVGNINKKGDFYIIECRFVKNSKTFLHGSETCILEDRFLQ